MKKTILLAMVLTSVFLYGCSNATPSAQQNTNQPTVDNTQQVTQPTTPDVQAPTTTPVVQTPPANTNVPTVPVAPGTQNPTVPPNYPTPPNPSQVNIPSSDPIAKTPLSQSAGQTVIIQNFTFNPGVINIKVGATVVWTNMDPMPHKIKSDSFNSSDLSQGQSFSFKFDKAGTYDYICGIHPSMKGQVIVK
jgi:plastocyanin